MKGYKEITCLYILYVSPDNNSVGIETFSNAGEFEMIVGVLTTCHTQYS